MENIKKDLLDTIKSNITIINTYKYINPDIESYDNKYRAVLAPIYNNYDGPLSIVVFDFDKLSLFNKTFGKEKMNKSIDYVLTKIRSLFPNGKMIRYLSGDEYCLLLPGITKEEAQKTCNQLQDFLLDEQIKFKANEREYTNQSVEDENYKDTTYGETATFVVKDNEQENDISKLVQEGFHEVSIQKQKRQFSATSEQQYNKQLLADCIDKFFTDLRFPEDSHSYSKEGTAISAPTFKSDPVPITPEILINQILPFFTELTIDNLLENFCNFHTDTVTDSTLPYTKEEAQEIEIFLNDMHHIDFSTYSIDELYSFNQKLETIKELLVREPLTNLPSKTVFKTHMAKQLADLDRPYQFIYVSTSDVKSHNSMYGYDATNIHLKDLVAKLESHFGANINFNQDPFTFSSGDTFILDLGGGNYCLGQPMENAYTPTTLSQKCNMITDNGNSTLPIFVSSSIYYPDGNPDSVVSFVRNLRENCHQQKEYAKAESFCKSIPGIEAVYPGLKKHLSEFFVHSLQPARDAMVKDSSFASQRKFVEEVVSEVVSYFNSRFIQNDKTKPIVPIASER